MLRSHHFHLEKNHKFNFEGKTCLDIDWKWNDPDDEKISTTQGLARRKVK